MLSLSRYLMVSSLGVIHDHIGVLALIQLICLPYCAAIHLTSSRSAVSARSYVATPRFHQTVFAFLATIPTLVLVHLLSPLDGMSIFADRIILASTNVNVHPADDTPVMTCSASGSSLSALGTCVVTCPGATYALNGGCAPCSDVNAASCASLDSTTW